MIFVHGKFQMKSHNDMQTSLLRLVIVFVLLGNPSLASAISKGNVRKSLGQSAKTLFSKGFSESNAGHYEDAIPYFVKSLELEPDMSAAWTQLGFIYEITGDGYGALSSYGRAFSQNPDDRYAQDRLVKLGGRMGRRDGMDDAYKNGLDSPRALSTLLVLSGSIIGLVLKPKDSERRTSVLASNIGGILAGTIVYWAYSRKRPDYQLTKAQKVLGIQYKNTYVDSYNKVLDKEQKSAVMFGGLVTLALVNGIVISGVSLLDLNMGPWF